MVFVKVTPQTKQLKLTPDASLNWRSNVKVISFILSLHLLIGIGFWLAGAWLILPFAGLEIAIFSISLYVVSRKLHSHEIITIDNSKLTFKKGYRASQLLFQLELKSIQFSHKPLDHSANDSALFIYAPTGQHQVGQYLHHRDIKKIVSVLREWGIPVTNAVQTTTFLP